jgi:hypothetical protein
MIEPSIDSRDEELTRMKREHAAMLALLREHYAAELLPGGELLHSEKCMANRPADICQCFNGRVAALLLELAKP